MDFLRWLISGGKSYILIYVVGIVLSTVYVSNFENISSANGPIVHVITIFILAGFLGAMTYIMLDEYKKNKK